MRQFQYAPPAPCNPRQNNHAVEHIANSIQRFGFASPIVARREDLWVIAGHTRLRAALQLGLAKVPVRLLDVSTEEADALALADNKLGELADWDDDALADILSDWDRSNLSELGWGESELQALLDTDDFTEVVWKEFDGTVAAEEKANGKSVTCPDCGHGFRV